MKIPGAGKVELVYTAEDGTGQKNWFMSLMDLESYRECIISINPSKALQEAAFSYALDTKQDLWFATKDTISKNMIIHSKISFRKSLMQNMLISSKKRELSISTH